MSFRFSKYKVSLTINPKLNVRLQFCLSNCVRSEKRSHVVEEPDKTPLFKSLEIRN